MTRYQLQVKFPGEDWENTVYKSNTDRFTLDRICEKQQRLYSKYDYRVIEVK